VGAGVPVLQAAQFAECVGANAQNCTDQNFNPIGTGPYMVEEFRANDVITYVRNPNYRVEGKPFFDRVILKGGGDAESAARSVLEIGEADYAWNLQISPAVLNTMEAAGNGTVVVGLATNIERLILNHTNPDPSLDQDHRAVYFEDGSNAHPFLTNPIIKQALSMAIDRNIIAEQLYGAGGRAACNIINGPPHNVSTANDSCLVQDIAGANALLDEAGIVDTDGDNIREYEGVPLRVLYQTSTNAVRQSTQALIKQWWSEIGVEAELRNIDAAVFFGGDPASPDTLGKFYADIQMYTSGTDGPDAETFLARWRCDDFPGPANNWLGDNAPRWCNAEYDAVLDELAQTAGIEARAVLTIQLNDIFVQDFAEIPLIHRGSVSAYRNDLEGVLMNGWDSELWNIADWTRAG
jgi:peptide/nickel transport system substrate-binding protein